MDIQFQILGHLILLTLVYIGYYLSVIAEGQRDSRGALGDWTEVLLSPAVFVFLPLEVIYWAAHWAFIGF